MTAHPTPASRLFAVPPQPASDLTPYRCIWLRENVKGFAEMQDAAEKAMAEAARAAAKIEGRRDQ
jgi:hypothetical protein